MKKLMEVLEKGLMPLAAKMSQQRHLNALRDGFTYTMPFLIVGSFVLLFLNLPFRDPDTAIYIEVYDKLMRSYKSNLIQPFYVSMGIMSLFIAFGVGSSLSQSYGLNGTTGGFLALYGFLINGAKLDFIPIGGYVGNEVSKNDYLLNTLHKAEGWMPVMDARYLDANGLFTAIISAFAAIEIYRILVKKSFTIRLPDSVPPAITKSFELLTPIILVTFLFHGISLYVQNLKNIFIPQYLLEFLRPLLNASDTLPAVLFLIIVVHILWFAGLHGVNVVVAIVNPIILSNLAINAEAFGRGAEIPKIFAGGFLDSFVYLGGSGATIGLAIAMIMSKSEHLRSIGKISIVPGLFNINEPVIFGAPIVMNPVLLLPFVGIPIINTCIAWFATSSGLINKVVTLVPWTTPGPIAAILATGDVKAAILSVLLIAFSTIMYYPFLKIYEKTLEKEERKF